MRAGPVEAAEADTDENPGPVGTSCERILGSRLGKCILTTATGAATVAETKSRNDDKEKREGGFFFLFPRWLGCSDSVYSVPR